MVRSGNVPALVPALLLAALVPAPASGDGLAVSSSGPVAPDVFVEALRLRVQGTVEYRPGSRAIDGTWVLEVLGGEGSEELTLRSPDGRSWTRTLSLEGQDGDDRAREVALKAGYVALLAGAPFALDDVPPAPAGAAGDDGDQVGLLLELWFGGSGDLWGQGSGRDEAIDLAGRVGFAWPWGLWVELEGGWQRIPAGASRTLALDWAPLRAGIGGILSWDPWELRFAVQALAEFWRVSGDARHPSGWRGGVGLLVGGAYRVAPWCLVGVEAGLDFSPRAVQIDDGGRPTLTSGQLRWRAGAVVGFEAAGL